MLKHITLLSVLVLSFIVILLPNLLWLTSWLVGLCFGGRVPYAPYGWTAAVLEITLLLLMGYGIFIGRFRLEVNQQEYCSKEVPASLNGYKIVHISDLHLSTFDDRPSALQRVVDNINSQNPDLICFTGDLVGMGVEEAKKYKDILRQLHAKDGIFSVLGNHDFLIYRHDFTSDKERMKEVDCLVQFETDSLGWNVLRNEHRVLENGLTIVGVDNCSCSGQGFKTIRAGNLPKAMNGTDGFRILMSHDPSHWRAEIVGKQPIALTLSGHTHAGQVRIFAYPLSAVAFRDNEGWYKENSQALYINRGIGCTLPLRINCPEEITVITLRR